MHMVCTTLAVILKCHYYHVSKLFIYVYTRITERITSHRMNKLFMI